MDRYVTGAVIKKLRESKKMTQEDLAERIHVSGKAVSKWETGGKPCATCDQRGCGGPAFLVRISRRTQLCMDTAFSYFHTQIHVLYMTCMSALTRYGSIQCTQK
ncbi:MAG: helix-turn-helix transcriptional regulator [Mogibacterium sp.]|nr:helix-turn-helix transcriptional regulator [Mogibacterium sp.]